MSKPIPRLAVDMPLREGATLTLADNTAHYLTTVLRLKAGDSIALFNRNAGEWRATITATGKKEVTLIVAQCLRPPSARSHHLTVCFAPIKGGRMETIIEKATELGASVLQPVITARTIVDKVNLARAEAIAREAAEQSERIDWPEIREPVKLLNLLGDWPKDVPLIYGDESGLSPSIHEGLNAPRVASHGEPERSWAILAGPEGGFTPDEFAALQRVNAAIGVGLGPRILRADTAVITLCAITMLHWGDWGTRPRFVHEGDT
ncbi:MAG: 16S rRNA (uracil(1498)-N(3))-methyltransferase [Rickettsiales bacterium]|nr:16S rRNA (uracil(1498)-N(3))-methyltransferase [Rickettsiales bacterium]